jgi:hypothetical protein
MGSHYIQVKNLQIEALSPEVIAAVCVNNGYVDPNNPVALGAACTTGGYVTPPDPAIYCPAKGYIPDPDIYVPPLPIPPTTTESLTFICNASVAHWRCATNRYQFIRNGSNLFKYEVFDNTGALINTFTSNLTYIDFDFPTASGYYTVKVSLASPSYFTGWYNNDGGANSHNDCIEAVLVNCPTGFTAFSIRGNNNVNSVEFTDATLSKLNSLAFMFEACPSLVRWPVNWAAITNTLNIYSAFSKTGLTFMDMSAYNEPSTVLADSMFNGCKYLTEVIMPNTWSGTRNYSMFAGTIRLRKVRLPQIWAPSGAMEFMNNFFQNSGIEGEVILENAPGVTNFHDFANGCPNLTALRFKGNYNFAVTGAQYMINNCPVIKEFEAPRSIGNVNISGGPFDATSILLEKYIGPDIGYLGFPIANSPLKSITGEHNNSGSVTKANVTLATGAQPCANLTVFQAIKLQCTSFSCGQATNKYAVLTTLEIDWANSPWSSTNPPQLRISAALSDTELNRIMTALPTVVNKVFDAGYCNGWIACDKNIAQAKGWTMRGAPIIQNGSMSPVGRTTATFNGQLDHMGGFTPITAGVCFATTQNPTASNNPKNASLTATGAFTVAITSSLTANTLYYARAYAYGSYGVYAYGTQFTFQTLP